MGHTETQAQLTQAFDLELSDPVRLETRPENGWCFGRPPGIDADRWPMSPVYGTPLRHAFTLKVPAPYRTQGPDRIAISLFIDEMFDERRLVPLPTSPASPSASGGVDAHRHDMQWGRFHLSMFWLSAEEFAGALGTPPMMEGADDAQVPGWLVDRPADYFGHYNLPSNAFHRPRASSSAPGAHALQQLMETERPPSGWATLPAMEALDFGFPIDISPREGDPNVGRPASEWEEDNVVSGYIPAYSGLDGAANLERFAEFEAHLGGTMFPAQAYPEFSPFYLEFQETFGGFAFAGGLAQLDLKEMQIAWAS